MYSNRNTDYLQKLVNSRKRVYKVAEIATIWSISDKNKLHTYLKRYADKKSIFRLDRGIYSLVVPTDLHPYEIGVALAGDLSYISLETALFIHGLISQPDRIITLVGKKNKRFSFGGNDYHCRYQPLKKLVDRQGIIKQKGYDIADASRAKEDLIAIKPNYYLDSNNEPCKAN